MSDLARRDVTLNFSAVLSLWVRLSRRVERHAIEFKLQILGYRQCSQAFDCIEVMEAAIGIEPMNKGFAAQRNLREAFG
jgi:hypothetical protein